MKVEYSNFIENVNTVHKNIKNGEVSRDLTYCLAGKEIGIQTKILKNLILVLSYIINNPVLSKSFSGEEYIAVHHERKKTKSLFPSQTIRNEGKFQLVVSYKGKISSWVAKGKVKKVKEALIFYVGHQESRWYKGVDAVAHEKNITSAMEEIKLSGLIKSDLIHRITEGASYSKKWVRKKSIISFFAEGGSLEKLMLKVDLLDIFVICFGSVKALLDLHAEKIIHGDIHPGNIYLFPDESKYKILRPKIADLGESKHYTCLKDFNFNACLDVRSLASALALFLQSCSLENKDYQKQVEILFEEMKNIKYSLKNNTAYTFLKRLHFILLKMEQEGFKKESNFIYKNVTIYYPKLNKKIQNSCEDKAKPASKPKDCRLLISKTSTGSKSLPTSNFPKY